MIFFEEDDHDEIVTNVSLLTDLNGVNQAREASTCKSFFVR